MRSAAGLCSGKAGRQAFRIIVHNAGQAKIRRGGEGRGIIPVSVHPGAVGAEHVAIQAVADHQRVGGGHVQKGKRSLDQPGIGLGAAHFAGDDQMFYAGQDGGNVEATVLGFGNAVGDDGHGHVRGYLPKKSAAPG